MDDDGFDLDSHRSGLPPTLHQLQAVTARGASLLGQGLELDHQGSSWEWCSLRLYRACHGRPSTCTPTNAMHRHSATTVKHQPCQCIRHWCAFGKAVIQLWTSTRWGWHWVWRQRHQCGSHNQNAVRPQPLQPKQQSSVLQVLVHLVLLCRPGPQGCDRRAQRVDRCSVLGAGMTGCSCGLMKGMTGSGFCAASFLKTTMSTGYEHTTQILQWSPWLTGGRKSLFTLYTRLIKRATACSRV